MSYTIYQLQFSNGKHYVGMTVDLQRRLQEHKSGKTKSTKNRTIIAVRIIETCADRTLARKREKYWKSGTGREQLKGQ